MKLTTVIENTSCREDVGAEHGLSLYVETADRKLLFDSGQSGDLLEKNAASLGIDLKSADTFVLSHGHYDHGGGLCRFLELNKTADIYASDLCFGDFYNGPTKYIGLNPVLRDNLRIRQVSEKTDLGDGLTLYPGRLVPTPRTINSYGLYCRHKHLWIPDTFLHEQYLLLEEQGKRILFSGCSHRGIMNIAEYFQPDILIGGFHLKKVDPETEKSVLTRTAEELLALPTTYYTCHCTGKAQYEVLKSVMGDRLHYLAAGSTLEV